MSVPQKDPVIPELITQKVEAFEQLEPEFETSFHFIQEVHGQKRFASFPVEYSVRYLHALWICECKDRLLSVYKNIRRYEGRQSLELLKNWQDGARMDTASVVDFLQAKLDMLPLGNITRQWQEAKYRQEGDGLPERLIHGRMVLLNRGMNLMHALDAIFVVPEEQLLEQVRKACATYKHEPARIERQLAETNSPLFSYEPHQILAQRNMVVMNKLGINAMNRPTDQPGERSWRVLEPTEPMAPYAEHVIEGYVELTTPVHNNPKQDRFVDRPERSEDMEV